jgi:flagellar motor switch protein FliN/FliY
MPADSRETALQEAEIELRVVLGTTTVRVSDVLKLGRGAVVELDRNISAPSDVLAAGILIARGQVAIVEDRLAIQITEFVKSTGQRR